MNSLIKKALSVQQKTTKKVEVTKDLIELVEYYLQGKVNDKQVGHALGISAGSGRGRVLSVLRTGVQQGQVTLKY